jgi:hypothetical protein
LRGVGEFAERRHLAALDREDVHPFGVDRLAGFAQLPTFATEHEDHVAGSMKVARRERHDFLKLTDQPEEFAHSVLTLAHAEQRIILRPAHHFPGHVGSHRPDYGSDVAASERGVKALR